MLNGDLRLFLSTLNFLLFKETVKTLIRCRVLRRLIRFYTVCQYPSPCFREKNLHTAFRCLSDKNSAVIHNRYLDFVQTRGLILLVNDNHVDNDLQEFLVHAYFGSIVNNQTKISIAYVALEILYTQLTR